MTETTRRIQGKRRNPLLLGIGLALTGSLVLGGVYSAQATTHNDPEVDPVPGHVEPGTEDLEDLRNQDPHLVPVSDEILARIPILIEPGNPDGGELKDAYPTSLAVSADGKFAYASWTKGDVHEIYVFDLAKRMHIKTMQTDPGDWWGGSLRAAKDANVLTFFDGDNGVVVIDTTTHTEIARYPAEYDYGHRVAISDDGNWLYMLESDWGETVFHKMDLRTGEIFDGPRFEINPNGQLTVSPDGTTVALGLGGGYKDANLTLIDVDSMEIIGGPYLNTNLWQFEGMTFDSTGTALYTTAFSRTIAKISQEDGQNITRITAGDGLADVLPVPDRDRAWAASYWENLIVVADFENKVRSTSFRETPGGPNELVQSSNGDLLVSNAGGDKDHKDNSIGIILAPRVTTQPVDAQIAGLGESVTFTAQLVGVKADADSGVTWQSSPDGTTWTDLDEHTTTLTLTADASAAALQYRMSYTDEFWGQTGFTNAVRILGVQPVITSAAILHSTKVDEAMTPILPTVTAQPDHVWSAEGLPSGLSINAETGEITGTPTAVGKFAITLTVTDMFGTATQQGTITVTSDDGGDDSAADGSSDGNADGGSDAGADGGSDGSSGGSSDSGAKGSVNGGSNSGSSASGSANGNGLAATGSLDATVGIAIGALVLAAGAVLLFARRRALQQ